MKKKLIIATAFVIALTAGFYGFNLMFARSSTASPEKTFTTEKNSPSLLMAPEDEQRVDLPDLTGWPEASKKAAKDMESKYGKPNAITPDMLVWNNNGIWLKTIVYKKEMRHDFPKAHTDVVEQWINYRVPLNSYDELALYDGSVTANRTNGTISVRCDNESMNFLALNLAYDIFNNNKAVDKARSDYGRDAMAFMKGEKPMYTQKLNFSSDKSAPDPDKSLEMMKEKTTMGGSGQ